jgi:hypothetical protein
MHREMREEGQGCIIPLRSQRVRETNLKRDSRKKYSKGEKL